MERGDSHRLYYGVRKPGDYLVEKPGDLVEVNLSHM
jgi:hypothetical protein